MPVTFQTLEMVPGPPPCVGPQTMPQVSDVVMDPVAPTAVATATSGLQGVMLVSCTTVIVQLTGPMMFTDPLASNTAVHTPPLQVCETSVLWVIIPERATRLWA